MPFAVVAQILLRLREKAEGSKMSTQRGHLRIGTSGYQYDHWRGGFYPRNIPHKGWFAYYASHFDTVEVNSTFYRLPSAQYLRYVEGAGSPGFLLCPQVQPL